MRGTADTPSTSPPNAPPDARPFSLGPARAAAGVLVLHGFTGTPFEMRLLGDSLAAHELAVEGPCLAGHGGSTADLAASRWPDWVASADRALDRLRARAERVAVCGLSMGGLVALELARRRPNDIAAFCGLATALSLWPSALRFVSLTRRLPLIRGAALPKLAGSDILDSAMRRLNGTLQGKAWMSLAALASLVDFGAHVRAHLGEVRTPALIAHARHDHTVPFASMDTLAEGLGTPRADLRRLILERSQHVITLDVEREVVFRAVADHVLEYTRR